MGETMLPPPGGVLYDRTALSVIIAQIGEINNHLKLHFQIFQTSSHSIFASDSSNNGGSFKIEVKIMAQSHRKSAWDEALEVAVN